MTELIEQTGKFLQKSQELLNEPAVKNAVSGVLKWIGDKIFSGKKSTKEKLLLIEQQKASESTIEGLKANLELVLEDNEELCQQLQDKLNEIEDAIEQTGIHTTKTNKAEVRGDSNKFYQDINNSNINDNSNAQSHYGSGDNIGRDKIISK